MLYKAILTLTAFPSLVLDAAPVSSSHKGAIPFLFMLQSVFLSEGEERDSVLFLLILPHIFPNVFERGPHLNGHELSMDSMSQRPGPSGTVLICEERAGECWGGSQSRAFELQRTTDPLWRISSM